MSAHDFLELLHIRPFKPFRIHVSDGTVFDVHHPELVITGSSSVIVGSPPVNAKPPLYYERFQIVSMSHVARLEPLETAASA